MTFDYKRHLEKAAKKMILVHEPRLLTKMIIRLMVQKVKVPHAGVILYDDRQREYTLYVSSLAKKISLKRDFVPMDYNNPLIRFFRERKDRKLFGGNLIIYKDAIRLLDGKMNYKDRNILHDVVCQMEILGAVVCIPSYFREELLGMLFLGKKANGRNFQRQELNFFVEIASEVAMAIRNARLFQQLQEELENKKQLFLDTAITLASAIESKDHYTLGHTQRVTDLSLKIGRKLMKSKSLSLSNKFLEHLHIAALFHDIGKIDISEMILNKKGPLIAKERLKMQLHPGRGAEMLQQIRELEPAIKGIKYHHERFDGKGYPNGLKGNEIPIIAAIIAVADTFDAITSNRPYRKAMSKKNAIKEIKRVSGRQLHPQVVFVLLQLSKDGKI